ncbi:MAG: class I SAM-dependent methyltransferase [Anaerolineae bacterium]
MIGKIEFIQRPHCELCGAQQPATLLARPFTDPAVWSFIERYYEGRVDKSALDGAAYELACCPNCGFIWQKHILNDSGMALLYDTWIAPDNSLKKKQSINIAPGYLRQAELMRLLMSSRHPQDIRVLDFGMGWGYWCKAAQSLGYQVVGLELAESRIAFAREQGIEAVQTLDELSGRTFDFINAEQVFEHIPRPLETLKTLCAYLSDNGVIRIAVPDGANIAQEVAQPTWTASKNAVHPLEHINCFTHATLSRLGTEAGLSVIPQPINLTLRYGVASLLRGIAASTYRRFAGTAIYFRKE